MAVPNQKQIIINKLAYNPENTYSINYHIALQNAMINLKNSSLRMWLYLSSNQNGYAFYLSKVDCAKWGIKTDAYHSAVKDLIKRGYLVEIQDKKNLYNFYEIPPVTQEKTI